MNSPILSILRIEYADGKPEPIFTTENAIEVMDISILKDDNGYRSFRKDGIIIINDRSYKIKEIDILIYDAKPNRISTDIRVYVDDLS